MIMIFPILSRGSTFDPPVGRQGWLVVRADVAKYKVCHRGRSSGAQRANGMIN